MARTQEHRAVEIATPLGRDVLLFHRMTATESLGRLFHFELDLLSEENTIKFEDLLGQRITVRLDLAQGKIRYFSGHVSRFTQASMVGNLYAYHATVHPWLWFLTRTATCRIFQEKTIPDIIKEVFRGQGFTDYEEALSGGINLGSTVYSTGRRISISSADSWSSKESTTTLNMKTTNIRWSCLIR